MMVAVVKVVAAVAGIVVAAVAAAEVALAVDFVVDRTERVGASSLGG